MARNQTKTRKQQRKSVPPTLIAYHVADRGKSSFWTRIGAAWEHEDGKGYSVQLDLLPADGGRLVLRPPRDDSDDADEAQDAEDASEAEDAAETEEADA